MIDDLRFQIETPENENLYLLYIDSVGVKWNVVFRSDTAIMNRIVAAQECDATKAK